MDRTSLSPESGSNQEGFHQVADEECDVHGEVSGRFTKSKGLLADDGSDKCVNHNRRQSMDKTSLPPESGRNQAGFHQVVDEECDVHGEVSGRFTKSKGLLAENGSDKCVNYKKPQSMDKTSLPPVSGSNQKGFHDVADEECDIHGEVSGRSTKSKGSLAENGSDKCVNHKRSQSMDKTSLPPESGSNHEGFHQVADAECDVHGEVSGRFTQSTGLLAENGSDKCVDYKKPQLSGFRFNDQENLPLQYHGKHMKEDSYVSMLLLESKLVETKENGLRLYQLPMKELLGARNGRARTNKYDLGLHNCNAQKSVQQKNMYRSRNGNDLKTKTIMLVGATGTGKSTFIDGLANYILGVRLEYSFRFTVISNEDKVRQHNQAESQTDWISCYSFKPQTGTRIPYRLNIIDTPGFGDVRGLERDNETVDQIRQLFEETGEKGVENLDAVCFLLKAPDSRLTAIQRYIFQAIMALFGHNIKENICTVITFADGTEPPVLSAMEASHLPFGQHKFTFNNSALMSGPNISLTSVFWEMNLQNYEEMFKHFETLQTESARLTKEVLQERRRLDITCQNLQIKINVGLSRIDSLNKEIKIFQDNEEKIRNNENFEYTVTERKDVKINVQDGYSDTYCLTCNETCHINCWIKREKLTGWCWAMNWRTGKCDQCRGKCHWRQHTNRTYRIETSEIQITKTYEERKKNFQDAKGNRLTLADVLKKMDKELEQLADSIEEMLNVMLECKTRLMKTALQPSPLDMTDLIDLLITSENYERSPGYSNRVQVLHKIRERTTIQKTVKDFKVQRFCQKETLAATCKEF